MYSILIQDLCTTSLVYVKRCGSHQNVLFLRNDLYIQKQVFILLTRHILRPIPYLIDDQIIQPKRASSKEQMQKYGSSKEYCCKSLCQLILKTIFHFQ